MRQVNLNTFILAILTVCTGAIGFFMGQIITDVKKNNDILVEVRTNQQNVMGDVRDLKAGQSLQDRRLDKVESRVDYLENGKSKP